MDGKTDKKSSEGDVQLSKKSKSTMRQIMNKSQNLYKNNHLCRLKYDRHIDGPSKLYIGCSLVFFTKNFICLVLNSSPKKSHFLHSVTDKVNNRVA